MWNVGTIDKYVRKQKSEYILCKVTQNIDIWLTIGLQQGDQLCSLWSPRGVGGWEGGARGRRYRDICICIADSLCYKAETNIPL